MEKHQDLIVEFSKTLEGLKTTIDRMYAPPFRLPEKNIIAKAAIKEYRDSMPPGDDTKVIMYEADDILKYLLGPYQDFIKAAPNPPKGYHWVVGFYLKKEDYSGSGMKTAFYVMPTIKKDGANEKDIYDYFDENNLPMYDNQSATPFDDQESPYDAGHLWP